MSREASVSDNLPDHITLKELLVMLGEDYRGAEHLAAKRRLARRLRNLEESTGTKLLFGGGQGHRGRKIWTSRAALRQVWPHLMAADENAGDRVSDVAQEIANKFIGRLEEAEMKIEFMAKEIVQLKMRL